MAALIAVVLSLLVVAIPAYAVEHKVGDSDGWASGVDYDAWASGKTFAVGDTLVFKYQYPLHTVTEVSESDYKDCSDANSIKTYTDENTKISLAKPGTRYFICATPGHCFAGMKLAVTVSGAASSKTPASSSSSYEPEYANTSSPSAAKVPPAAATGGAAVAGGSLAGKALLMVAVSLLGVGLMG